MIFLKEKQEIKDSFLDVVEVVFFRRGGKYFFEDDIRGWIFYFAVDYES